MMIYTDERLLARDRVASGKRKATRYLRQLLRFLPGDMTLGRYIRNPAQLCRCFLLRCTEYLQVHRKDASKAIDSHKVVSCNKYLRLQHNVVRTERTRLNRPRTENWASVVDPHYGCDDVTICTMKTGQGTVRCRI